MVAKHSPLHSLTAEQRRTLVRIVRDECGYHLTSAAFSESILNLLDDVAGFETIAQSESRRLIKELWEMYRNGQKAENQGEQEDGCSHN